MLWLLNLFFYLNRIRDALYGYVESPKYSVDFMDDLGLYIDHSFDETDVAMFPDYIQGKHAIHAWQITAVSLTE